ncbi:copine family member IX [Piromyces finnis]|uniref:Copine family member IX n=1 Tax=Piromyces finnis TaxID=1754191 RepID=A0A1Y1V0X4_9FUNG|nr:copine family member IX [Piromyces finnis]|eukprot:ORX44170.1 copine family member IX [Piromyces finnis]
MNNKTYEPDCYHYPNYGNSQLCSKIELRFSCKDLPNLDTLSKSDPKIFIFLEQKSVNNEGKSVSSWSRVGATERIDNDLNPTFLKSFIIDYYFEMIQRLRFIIFDMDDNSDSFKDNDFIGYYETTIGDLVGSSRNNVYTGDILTTTPPDMNISNKKTRKSSKKSKLIVNVEEIQDSNTYITMNVRGTNLDKKDLFGKSDPYFVISKSQENGTVLKIFESSVIKNTLNPLWKDIRIKESTLNNGDDERMILWEVYDWDRNSSPDFIGSFETSTKLIKQGNSFNIINKKKLEKYKKKGKQYNNSGVISFENVQVCKDFSFMDFPMLGTEISVTFAIDFTGSNGEVTDPRSLHYRSPNCDLNNFMTLNEYQKAISAIGYVLEPYDSTKYMEVYGYGAKFFNRPNVEFDCALTGNQDTPAVLGVNGILYAYSNALESVEIWGPTNFAPIIKKITERARIGLPPKYQNAPLQRYHILTIITDGEISDMECTKRAIIDACDAPLSIIIIGVGNGNFDSMVELDGDDDRLHINNKYAERDIVQFVPLSNYISNPSLLACETLAEIPKQVTEFARLYKYKPYLA